MNKNGIGIGSAFLTLIFVALCLAVLTMISHAAAENEMALAKAEAALVRGYYEADALASRIAGELTAAETIPESLFGVDIIPLRDEAAGQNEDTAALKAEYSVPMSQTRELYVVMALHGNAYEILTWRIRDTNRWLPDTTLPIRRP